MAFSLGSEGYAETVRGRFLLIGAAVAGAALAARSRTPARTRQAITVRRPQDEVAAAWSDFSRRPARFAPAPADQGTEIVVEVEYRPNPIAGLRGEDPATKVADELRRFKQLLETGEVARSDTGTHEQSLAEQLLQRAAQPQAARR